MATQEEDQESPQYEDEPLISTAEAFVGGGDDFLTEEEEEETEPSTEQQVLENARDLLGLGESNGSDQKNTDSFVSRLLRPLATAPFYPVNLVQVS